MAGALLASAAAAWAGPAFGPPVSPATAGVGAAAAPPVQAFYIIFTDQIDNGTAFPGEVCQNDGAGPQGGECVGPFGQYAGGVVIAQPINFTAAHVAKLKAAAPGALVLAYVACPGGISRVCPAYLTGHDSPGVGAPQVLVLRVHPDKACGRRRVPLLHGPHVRVLRV